MSRMLLSSTEVFILIPKHLATSYTTSSLPWEERELLSRRGSLLREMATMMMGRWLIIIPSPETSYRIPERSIAYKACCGQSKFAILSRIFLTKLTRQRYTRTHPDADPHTLKTLKHFAEFMARTIPGLLDPSGKPTVQTVRNHFRCFISGWNLNNPLSRISADLKDSITNVSSHTYGLDRIPNYS